MKSPDLTLPHIHITYAALRKWSERKPVDEFDPEGKQELLNIPIGALIVVDEVQKLWPAQGAKISEDIKDLSEHRHFGYKKKSLSYLFSRLYSV